MLERSLDALPFQPRLSSASRSPTPPPLDSPRIRDSIQKEIEAMEIELANVTETLQTCTLDCTEAQILAQDSSIL